MAKRKNAIALFEVITATKRKEREAEERQALGTPKWRFLGRGSNGHASQQDVDPTSAAYVSAATPIAYAAPEPQAVAPPVAAIPVEAAEFDPTAPAAIAAPVPAAPMLGQRAAATSNGAAVEPAPYRQTATSPQALSSTVRGVLARWRQFAFGIKKVGLDPDRQEVTVRFRYTTALLAGFAVMVALGLAFVMGRRSGPAAANSPSTKEIQASPVLVNVLNPDDSQIATIDIPADDPPPPAPAGNGVASPSDRGAIVKEPDRWAAPGVETRLPRVIGLNYVIMQSYHARKDAEAARDALLAAGIPSTIEPAPKSFSPNRNLFCVVGTHGFARPKSTPKFEAYKKAAVAVNEAFPKKAKNLHLEPLPYLWKQEDEVARRAKNR